MLTRGFFSRHDCCRLLSLAALYFSQLGFVRKMRALAAMLTGTAPLRVFIVLALSGTSTATKNGATAAAGDLDHEVDCY